jgi:putative solute:sodium symporter small subunit
VSPERAFWTGVVAHVVVLLAVWIAVAYGLGVLLRPALDAIAIAGQPLGLWIARQGAVLVFVAAVVVFVLRTAALERRLFGGRDAG